jgi:hypothetical protein
MRNRDAVLKYQETMTDTQVPVIDLDLVDPVSALIIEVECTNGATSNKGNFISDIVTKIELVDGGVSYVSLNMAQLEALYFYKTGKVPTMFPSEWGDGIQRHSCPLLFGRYLWDRAYAFNPVRFRNPQLKVTLNKAAIRDAGAEGFASGNNILLSVIAKVMEDVSAPGEFLAAKEIKSLTSAASGDERVELPIDYVYRLLMLRAWKQQSDIDEVISNIKLTCDTDKFIPFDRKVKQLDAEVFAQLGAGRIKHDVLTQHQAAFRLLFNKEPSFYGWSWEDATPEILGVRYTWSSEGKLDITDNAGNAITSDMKITGVEEGHALHATLPVFFGLPMEPDTWFNPTGYKKVEAVLTQATANAAVQLVLEQVRANTPV